MFIAHRYHDISTGHRVVGQGGKCEHLHGHNYRIHFYLAVSQVDTVGMVTDFGIIKATLCEWLELHWDHKFLVYRKDPFREKIYAADPEGIVVVEFNPTAENMAHYLVTVLGPQFFGPGDAHWLHKVVVEETRKCSASYQLDR